MIKLFRHILLLYCFAGIQANAQILRYNLETGDRYYLNLEMQQDTKSDNSDQRGNTSLAISSNLLVEVEKVTDAGDFVLQCRYEDLSLTFFSPQSDITISSADPAFTSLHTLGARIEKQAFTITLAPTGELIDISRLDSIIDALALDTIHTEHAQLMLRTVKEAFGENATRSLVNTAFNFYDEFSIVQGEKEAVIYFNARMIPILNNFYYQAVKDGNYRVQGIGATAEVVDTIRNDNSVFETRLKGNQTYDYLVNKETGWIIEGLSRQKIHSLTTIQKHPNLPKGLHIPSYTETRFELRGGKIVEK